MTTIVPRYLSIACMLLVSFAVGPTAAWAQDVHVSGHGGEVHKRVMVIRDGQDGAHSFSYFTGQRAFLGISMLELTPGLRAHFGTDDDAGVMISEVEPDSPAALAGLEAGDILLSIDGESVGSGHDVIAAIRPRTEGDTIELEVLRDGQALPFSATLVERERPNVDVGSWGWTSDGSGQSLELLLKCKDEEDCPEHLELGSENWEAALSTLHERVQSPDFQERIFEFHSGSEELEKRLEELEKQLEELQSQLDRLN